MKNLVFLVGITVLFLNFLSNTVDNIRFEVLDADDSIVSNVHITSTSNGNEFRTFIESCISPSISMEKGSYVFITSSDVRGFNSLENRAVSVFSDNQIVTLRIWSDSVMEKERLKAKKYKLNKQYEKAIELIERIKKNYPQLEGKHKLYEEFLRLESDIRLEMKGNINSNSFDENQIEVNIDERATNSGLGGGLR